ncbi:MAG: hypothetical protein AAF943_05505 [Pseudomonadota bacterium]
MLDSELHTDEKFQFDVATGMSEGPGEAHKASVLSNFILGRNHGFAVIAEGVGGQIDAPLASSFATTEVFSYLKLQENALENGKYSTTFVLQQAVRSANSKIGNHIKQHRASSGMGTALLVPMVRNDRLFWISGGNAFLYLLRDGMLRKINKDGALEDAAGVEQEVSVDAQVKNGVSKKRAPVNGDTLNDLDCPDAAVQLKSGDILLAGTEGMHALPNEKLAACLIEGATHRSVDIVSSIIKAMQSSSAADKDTAGFVVIKVATTGVQDGVIDLDQMPVVAQVAAETPKADAPKERKVRWYRGQKYYQD